MATGYLVALGADGILGIGDGINASPVTFTESGSPLATGAWQWTGVWSGNGQTYTDITDSGVYWLGTDGNTYFIPDTYTTNSGTATVTQALDGTVDGTSGDDTINGAYAGDPGGEAPGGGADTILAGAGNDTVAAGLGDDTIAGGSGNDSITGETGDDTITGGTGDDILRGDESAGAGRAAFQWSGLPDPDDGGNIDDGDALTGTATQTTGGTNVTFSYDANPTTFPDGTGGTDTTPTYSTLTNVTTGIDTGGSAVDPNSALWIGGDLASSMGVLAFDDPVTNVEFRVNDIDSSPGGFTDRVTVLAYDALGNAVPVTLTPGDNLILDAVNNNVTSDGNAFTADNPEASVFVSIPGPVSRIEIIYSDIAATGDDGLVNVTDVWFDEVADSVGDDSLSGGDGNDTLFGDAGNDILQGDADQDTLFGGLGEDRLDGGSGADSLSGDAGNDTIYGDGFTVDTGGGNLITNGNFEDATGMTATSYGFVGAGAVPGWTGTNPGDDIDFHNDGKGGIAGSDGANMLESAGSPTNLDVYQDVTGLTAGQTYQLTLDAGDADPDSDSRIEVYFGGELIGVIDPSASGALESFAFPLTSGTGDGTDRLRLVEVGNSDNDGMMIDNVQLYPTTPVAGAAGDTIDGGAGDDVIYGEAGADSIAGGADFDTLFGGTGADVLDGGDESDLLFGGAGDDTLDGGAELNFGKDDTLFGGDGNDTLTETETDAGSNDVLHGDAGNDTLSSAAGVDTLYGGADEDTLRVSDTSGADVIEGGESGADYDVLDGSGLTLDTTVTMGAPEAGTLLRNGETVNFIEIEDVRTGSGDDDITGSTGSDTIQSGTGSDTVDGGAGDDVIDLGDGTGPDGDADLLVFSDDDGADVVSNFDAPTLNVDGSYSSTDLLDVSDLTDADNNPVNTHDVMVSDDGLGNAVLTFPGGETLTLIGVSASAAEDPYFLNAMGIPIADGTVEGSSGDDTIDLTYLGDPDGDRIDGNDVLINGHAANDDLVYGYGGNDSITTLEGSDTVYGGTGNDSIDGGADADTIFGGNDADTIIGGAGDIVDGGEGGVDNDTLILSAVDRVDYDGGNTENGTVHFADGSTLVFSNIETVTVTDRDGTVSGSSGDDIIDGSYIGDPDGDIVDNNDAILVGDANNDDLIAAGAGNDTVIAGDGNDEIYAGIGDDSVTGDAGNDTIFGEGGQDTLSGGAGSDTIYGGGTLMGGGDNDFLFIYPGAPSTTVYGGAGGDLLNDAGAEGDLAVAGSGNDDFTLNAGNDTIVAGTGNDTVAGGDGDDMFWVEDGFGIDTVTGGETAQTNGDILDAGTNTYQGETGSDVVTGTTEDTTLTFSGAEAGTLTQNSDPTGNAITFTEIERVRLGSGDDTVYGGVGADVVDMGEGDDDFFLSTGFNADSITGGEGGESDGDLIDSSAVAANTTVDFSGAEAGTLTDGASTASFAEIEEITTGAGDDTVLGDVGNDRVNTGAGNDTLSGGAGNDIFDAGAGNDTIAGGAGRDTVFGGDGDDVFVLDDTSELNTLTGGEGAEVAGGDTIDATAMTTGKTLQLNSDGSGSLFGGGDSNTFVDIENINLGSGDDFVNALTFGGTANVDTGEGNDTYGTGAGDDTAVLGTGNDTLDLSRLEGTDTISGGENTGDRDLITAQNQTEDLTVTFTGSEAGSISNSTGTVNFDQFERIVTGSGDDTIVGDAGNDYVIALEGDDSFDMGAGNDSVYGGDGDDTFDGGSGNDFLSGGSGNDLFLSDAGNDILQGSADRDTFVYSDGFGADLIDGGAAGDNFDTIDLSGLSNPVTVVFSAPGQGTITDDVTGETIQFSNIERIITTNQADTVDNALDDGTTRIDTLDGVDTVTGSTGSEEIHLGDDDDIMSASAGNDTLYGDGGNDTLNGDTGDDTLFGGAGDDRLIAGNNTGVGDQLFGGDGNDTLVDSFFNATLDGGAGADTFDVGTGDATIFGGETGIDRDTLDFSDPNDTTDIILNGDESGTYADDDGDTGIFAGIEEFILTTGDDSFDGSAATTAGATVDAGAGFDTLIGGGGDDSFDAGAGNDQIDGGSGDDTIQGGDGDDWITLSGEYGNDTIVGGETGEVNQAADQLDAGTQTTDMTVTFTGAEEGTITNGTSTATFSEIEAVQTGSGADTVFGGVGNDWVSTLAGDDTIFGGAGDDFVLSGDGDDLIDTGTGADTVLAGQGNDQMTLGEGDYAQGDAGDDTFILADQLTGAGTPITVIGGNDDQTIGDTLRLGTLANLRDVIDNATLGPDGYSGTTTLNDGTVLNFSEIENIICFTPGTQIATPKGARDIATLKVGDLVVTRDHGLQPIRWIQSRTVPAMDRFAPVRIRPGVVTGLERDILVSPQHRMLFQGYRAELLFGETEVLVAAKHLIDGVDVTQDAGGDVTYIHMMFDEHEIVYAEGAASESFHPGSIGLSAIADEARDELFALFPELRSNLSGYGDTARRCLKRYEAELLRV